MWKIIIESCVSDQIIFRIMQQPRNIVRGYYNHTAKNGIEIISSCYPACCCKTLYIQGTEDDQDCRLLACSYYIFKKYVEALKEINNDLMILGKVRLK